MSWFQSAKSRVFDYRPAANPTKVIQKVGFNPLRVASSITAAAFAARTVSQLSFNPLRVASSITAVKTVCGSYALIPFQSAKSRVFDYRSTILPLLWP